MKLRKIQAFALFVKKYLHVPLTLIPALVIFILLVGSSPYSIARADWASFADSSLISACANISGSPAAGIPSIFTSPTDVTTDCGTSTPFTWLKDINVGTGLTESRSSSGATLSLANGGVNTTQLADNAITSGKLSTDLQAGWTGSNDTWSYASTNSFTISGVDRTLVYTPGTRIKATNNSSTFYGVVASSSFSTNTTVTLAANSDYSLANSAITNPAYSYQESPQGYPDWFSYTPTITGVTSPVGGAKFKLDGKSCTVNWQEVGGTSNATSFTITLPITPTTTLTGNFDVYLAQAYDNGTWQNSPGVVGIAAYTQAAKIGKTIASQAANAYGGFTASGSKLVVAEFTYTIQ